MKALLSEWDAAIRTDLRGHSGFHAARSESLTIEIQKVPVLLVSQTYMQYLTPKKFAVPINREEVTREWGRRGYSCDVFVDPPGREWNNFVHATNELVTVVSGTLRLTIAGEEFIAEPGDEVFIPKGVRHSVKNISSSTTHWLYGYD